MRIVELNREARENILSGLLKRDPNNYQKYEATVRQIVDDVRERGDEAVSAYTEKFDGVRDRGGLRAGGQRAGGRDGALGEEHTGVP